MRERLPATTSSEVAARAVCKEEGQLQAWQGNALPGCSSPCGAARHCVPPPSQVAHPIACFIAYVYAGELLTLCVLCSFGCCSVHVLTQR